MIEMTGKLKLINAVYQIRILPLYVTQAYVCSVVQSPMNFVDGVFRYNLCMYIIAAYVHFINTASL